MSAKQQGLILVNRIRELALPRDQGICEALGQERIPCLGIRIFAAAASAATPPGSVDTADLVMAMYLGFAVVVVRVRNSGSALVDALSAAHRIGRHLLASVALAAFPSFEPSTRRESLL